MAEIVEVLVDGGKASAGPPIGPALGPHGVNVVEVVNKINEVTKEFNGTTVPVKIIINTATKQYEIEVGTPPASALILKRAGIEKGSKDSKEHKVGNITIKDAIEIAKMKKENLLGKDMKTKTKEIIGTCVSMGIKVENKDPKDAEKEIEEGNYDSLFN